MNSKTLLLVALLGLIATTWGFPQGAPEDSPALTSDAPEVTSALPEEASLEEEVQEEASSENETSDEEDASEDEIPSSEDNTNSDEDDEETMNILPYTEKPSPPFNPFQFIFQQGGLFQSAFPPPFFQGFPPLSGFPPQSYIGIYPQPPPMQYPQQFPPQSFRPSPVYPVPPPGMFRPQYDRPVQGLNPFMG